MSRKTSTKSKSTYTRDDIKYINQQIESLKNPKDYKAIFKVLNSDPANIWTQNSSGVFIDLSIVSDTTLDKVTAELNKINKIRDQEIEVDTDVIPMSTAPQKDRTYKLSNYEQNIIKQRNLKKVIDNKIDYEELEFVKKSSRSESKTNSTKSTKSTPVSKSTKSTKSSKPDKLSKSKSAQKN